MLVAAGLHVRRYDGGRVVLLNEQRPRSVPLPDLVAADGNFLTVSGTQHPDLFWGLRGGGGNFGVVTSLEYRLYPVGPVLAGIVAYPMEKAREALRLFRDLTTNAPDELASDIVLITMPDGTPVVGMVVCYTGRTEEGERILRPLRTLSTLLMDSIGTMPYTSAQKLVDDFYPKGLQNYWKSSFLHELSEPAIDTMIAQFAASPSAMSGLVIEHIHGAATRVASTETAFPRRREGYNLLIVAEWLDPNETARNIAWARQTYDAMAPFRSQDRYVNYLAEDDVGDPIRAAYGPNYDRLRTLKTKYDPTNLFHLNQNIPPRFIGIA